MPETKRKLDRRYASDRERLRIQAQSDTPPAILYRKDLLHKAKRFGRGMERGYRDIAAATDLAPGTVQKAFDGDASKLDVLRKLAEYFDIDWLELFDVDRRLSFTEGKLTGIKRSK